MGRSQNDTYYRQHHVDRLRRSSKTSEQKQKNDQVALALAALVPTDLATSLYRGALARWWYGVRGWGLDQPKDANKSNFQKGCWSSAKLLVAQVHNFRKKKLIKTLWSCLRTNGWFHGPNLLGFQPALSAEEPGGCSPFRFSARLKAAACTTDHSAVIESSVFFIRKHQTDAGSLWTSQVYFLGLLLPTVNTFALFWCFPQVEAPLYPRISGVWLHMSVHQFKMS